MDGENQAVGQTVNVVGNVSVRTTLLHGRLKQHKNRSQQTRHSWMSNSAQVLNYTIRPNVMSSTKSAVHNVSQCRQSRTEPRPRGISTKNLVKIGPAVPEICSHTDWSKYSTPLPGRSNQATTRQQNTLP